MASCTCRSTITATTCFTGGRRSTCSAIPQPQRGAPPASRPLPNDSNFTSARTKTRYFHYFRDTSGVWHRNAIDLASIENFRGNLAVASSGNIYAILPDLRIAGASPTDDFASWTLLDDDDAGRFFSDPLIDTARLLQEDKLTVFYPARNSGNLYILDYTLD